MDTQQIKQRFGIIGTAQALDRAIDIATQVAITDLSVLITGESGVGKEVMPQIIHQLSARKHNKYIAVNCGAIPEGTIDSELFGHEKGAFTGAHDSRKGYFEVADGGTIFLDEVAELPIQTQVRLLRVLETGEFIGFIGLAFQNYKTAFTPATDIGWRLKKSAWGNGYATEGAKKCLEFGFNKLNLKKIISTCTVKNSKSESIMKKIGMEKIGEFNHPKLKEYPEHEKCICYEINKNVWQQRV